MDDKLTRKSQEALADAVRRATAQGHPHVEALHLLAALIEQDSGIAPPLLRAVGADPGAVLKETRDQLARLPKAAGGTVSAPDVARPILAALATAAKKARELDDEYVSTEHLLFGLAADGSQAAVVLCKHGATPEVLFQASGRVRGSARVTHEDLEGPYRALEKYGVDLTQQARGGGLDPVIGRDSEIRQVIRALSRLTRNNPVLIGERGVGKTAIVEGLAHRMVAGDAPESLRGERLFALDIGAMVAGAKSRVEFEERFKDVLSEIKASGGQVITFIDELHTVFGAGAAGSAVGAGSMLKPMLARGEIRMVGASTPDEYRERIEQDLGFGRYFQPVLVSELSVEDSIVILSGLKPRYEAHHQVKISDAALVAAVSFSDRYISGRFLPDKAIDLVDEAASRLRMEIDSGPEEIDDLQRAVDRMKMAELALARERDEASKDRLERLRAALADRQEQLSALRVRWDREKSALAKVGELKKRLDDLRVQVERAQRDADLATASKLMYGEIPTLEAELVQMSSIDEYNVAGYDAADGIPIVEEEVGPDDIADVVSAWTGISADRLLESEDGEPQLQPQAPKDSKCVFLVHASQDKAAVRELRGRLLAAGHVPWLDEEDIFPGQDWDFEIRKALGQADCVIVCLSSNSSNKIGYVQREIKRVLDIADEYPEGDVFVLPVRLEECEVPQRLRKWQYVDVFSPNGFQRILASLRFVRGK